MRRIALGCLAVVLGLVVAPECSNCRSAGNACVKDSECCDGLVCNQWTCGAPSALACPDEAPVDCGSTLPGLCCPSDLPHCCAKDSMCYASAADCNAPPSCDGKTCINSAGCCGGFVCERFITACQAAKNLELGETCTTSTQCASRVCTNGYCSRTCTRTSDCGPANECLKGVSGFICVPFCQGSADCRVFGTSIGCHNSVDPSGVTLPGCFSN